MNDLKMRSPQPTKVKRSHQVHLPQNTRKLHHNKDSIMSQPLSYWGCNNELPLIQDIAETFGDSLTKLSEVDQAWLIGKTAHHYAVEFCQEEASAEADEVIARLYELPKNQIGCLIQAIGNKGTKPLTYWGCNHELPLIQDISESFGENLQSLSELDQAWLLARLGSYYWLQHCDEAPSDEAQEIVDRIEELPQGQLGSLIQAFCNR
jgi:hypothetical protein